MLALISPAKTLDPSPSRLTLPGTRPAFVEQANQLAALLKSHSETELAALLGISPTLARLNAERFREFSTDAHPPQTKHAAALYRGDTYDGLDVDSWTPDDWQFAQGSLRILSGLYGLLRPLDGIQPYRLEMSSKLANPAGKDLYPFWDRRLSRAVTAEATTHDDPTVIHLASEAYIKAVPGIPLLTPVFLEARPEGLKVIALLAKRARGAMARFLVTRRLTTPEPLKTFNALGYRFREELSTPGRWVFVREQTGS
ncbi:MAG: peroxide stress protein YaaA [Magnetococcales bacterium]|nr:peroxide stress protein YaaA [Magnetococcales bacterium]